MILHATASHHTRQSLNTILAYFASSDIPQPQHKATHTYTSILQNNRLVGAKEPRYFMWSELNQEKTVMSMDSDTIKGRGDP